MDKIIIKGLKIFAYHGVNPEEKEKGQNFIFDIILYVNINKACRSDNVEDTVSYANVVKTVRKIFTSEKYNLIEKCAQITADEILNEYDEVFKVDLTLKKPQAPVNADFDYMAVNIIRSRVTD
ncbi:MAG: dihydroneopterin aldolase [Clostridiales bacterium]|nr:dihydroneopterin aldolase [Clostridiales bacterium]